MADMTRLRGFLIIFELIQLIKLAMVSLRRLMFSHTPREIREMTKPAYFEYSIGEPEPLAAFSDLPADLPS